MNNILDLFKGIGVIIDDDLNPAKKSGNDGILGIRQSFLDKNIPLLEYYELPSDEKCFNFHSISFLLLDWDLIGLDPGIPLPQAAINDNIAFVKQFNSICFAPIFIFSNESANDIQQELSKAGLYNEMKSNHIFIKSKSELKDIDLFSILEMWIRQTPSVYLLKEWEHSMLQAKHNLFWDFYNINPEWAKILHETINKDSTDLSYEMSEILFENLKNRHLPTTFDARILSQQNSQVQISADEIKQILEGQRFRRHDSDMIFTGDVFFKEGKYYINVRPQCDCIPRGDGVSIGAVNLFLIEGEEKEIDRCNFNRKLGLFSDPDIKITIFPINNGKTVQFEFGKFTMDTYGNWKQYRIGTLLPPFITRLIQKFTSYIQRQGLPRIPDESIK